MKAFESEKNSRSDYTTSGPFERDYSVEITTTPVRTRAVRKDISITPEKNFKKMSEESGTYWKKREEMKG